jgi:hypothetical protein
MYRRSNWKSSQGGQKMVPKVSKDNVQHAIDGEYNPKGSATRAKRREEAEHRQWEYNKLSTEQKIAKLDQGGHRALKQRAKLEAQP